MYKQNLCDLLFPDLRQVFARKRSFLSFWGSGFPRAPTSPCAYVRGHSLQLYFE